MKVKSTPKAALKAAPKTTAPKTASKAPSRAPETARSEAQGKKPEIKDRSEISAEAREGDKPPVNRAPEDPGREPRPAEEGKKPENPQDKDQQLEEMRLEIEQLKQQLEELAKKKEEEKKPENTGGCSGSHGAKEAGDKPNQGQDWNKVLLDDVAAVQAERRGQPAGVPLQPGLGAAGLLGIGPAAGLPGLAPGSALPGLTPGAAVPGAMPGGALAKLQYDYQQAKASGAKLRPEVEKLVQDTLNGGQPQPPQAGRPGHQGRPPAGPARPAEGGRRG
jgi:hypothetical protein